MSGICGLPTEIVMEIFTFLTYAEFFSRIMLVCREWDDLGKKRHLLLHFFKEKYGIRKIVNPGVLSYDDLINAIQKDHESVVQKPVTKKSVSRNPNLYIRVRMNTTLTRLPSHINICNGNHRHCVKGRVFFLNSVSLDSTDQKRTVKVVKIDVNRIRYLRFQIQERRKISGLNLFDNSSSTGTKVESNMAKLMKVMCSQQSRRRSTDLSSQRSDLYPIPDFGGRFMFRKDSPDSIYRKRSSKTDYPKMDAYHVRIFSKKYDYANLEANLSFWNKFNLVYVKDQFESSQGNDELEFKKSLFSAIGVDENEVYRSNVYRNEPQRKLTHDILDRITKDLADVHEKQFGCQFFCMAMKKDTKTKRLYYGNNERKEMLLKFAGGTERAAICKGKIIWKV